MTWTAGTVALLLSAATTRGRDPGTTEPGVYILEHATTKGVVRRRIAAAQGVKALEDWLAKVSKTPPAQLPPDQPNKPSALLYAFPDGNLEVVAAPMALLFEDHGFLSYGKGHRVAAADVAEFFAVFEKHGEPFTGTLKR